MLVRIIWNLACMHYGAKYIFIISNGKSATIKDVLSLYFSVVLLFRFTIYTFDAFLNRFNAEL